MYVIRKLLEKTSEKYTINKGISLLRREVLHEVTKVFHEYENKIHQGYFGVFISLLRSDRNMMSTSLTPVLIIL